MQDQEPTGKTDEWESAEEKRRRRTGLGSRIPAFVTIVLIIAGQWWLAYEFDLHPVWLFPFVSGAALVVSVAFYLSPRELDAVQRAFSVGLALIFVIVDVIVLFFFIHSIFVGSAHNSISLVISGGVLWVINVLVFAIVYWEIDCGGLERRINHDYDYPDFAFPQQQERKAGLAPKDWEPTFYDYLYLSLTNSTAFSPTDTMPYTGIAKFMMGVQALFAFMVFAILIARSVNIAAS